MKNHTINGIEYTTVTDGPYAIIESPENMIPLMPLEYSFIKFLRDKVGAAYKMHLCGSFVLTWLDFRFVPNDIDIWFTGGNRVLAFALPRMIQTWKAMQEQNVDVSIVAGSISNIEVTIKAEHPGDTYRFSLILAGAIERFDKFDLSVCSVAIDVDEALSASRTASKVHVWAPDHSVFSDISEKKAHGWGAAIRGELPSWVKEDDEQKKEMFRTMVERVKKYERRGFTIEEDTVVKRYMSIYGYACSIEFGASRPSSVVSLVPTSDNIDAISQHFDVAADAFNAWRRTAFVDAGDQDVEPNLNQRSGKGNGKRARINDGKKLIATQSLRPDGTVNVEWKTVEVTSAGEKTESFKNLDAALDDIYKACTDPVAITSTSAAPNADEEHVDVV